MLETRHGLLRTIALISKGLGIVLLILGIISLIAGLTAGGNMPAIVSTLARVFGLLLLLTCAFFFVILYAVGDMVLVLLGIEESTRALNERVASAAAAAPKTPAQPTRPLGSPSTRTSAASTILEAARERTLTEPPSSKEASSAAPAAKEGPTPQEQEDAAKRATEQALRAAEIARKSKQSGTGKQ